MNKRIAELTGENEKLRSKIAELERAKARETYPLQMERVAALNTVAQALSTSMELQEVLDQAIAHAAHALEFRGGLIALADERTGNLVLSSYTGLPRTLIEHLETQGINDAVCDFACREEIPLNVQEQRQDVPVDEHTLSQAGLQAYVGTPIVHKNRAVGTLCLFDSAPHYISDTDYELLAAIGQQIGMAVENARLFRDAVHEREVAQTLLDTAEALSTTLQLDTLLERILDELQRVVPYDAASISLLPDASLPRSGRVNGNSSTAWIAAARGLEHIPTAQREFILAKFPLVQQVVRERTPVIVLDARDEPNWIPIEGLDMVRSWLGVPLIFRHRVIGILMIDSHHPDAYDEETAQLAFAFAHQVALAIENSRLYGQTQAQLREALLLHSVTAALSSTLDMGQMLPYVTRSLCEILNCTSASIYSLDEETNTITIVTDYAASRSTEKEQRSNVGQTRSLTDLPTTAIAVALNQRRPLQARVNDSEANPRERAMLALHGVQAALLLPLVAHGHVIGLAAVCDSQSPRHFTEGEIAIGQTLTHQAAIAMENARLFAETQKSAQQIEALYETSRALSSSLEQETSIRTILEAVSRTLGCEYALIATVDEEAGSIGIRHSIWNGEFDASPEWMQSAQYPLDHPDILADIYRTGRTEVIEAGDERFSREVRDRSATTSGQEQFLRVFMPIKMRDRVTGVVEVGYDKYKRDHISKDKVQMLAAFMDQAAVALENARLFEEASRRVRELQFLHDVSLAAATKMGLEDTLQGAAEALAAEMAGTRVALLLLDSESSVLRLKAGVGYSPDMVGNQRFQLGEGICGWVTKHGKPAIVPDVRLDPRYHADAPDTRSELCVPLTAGPFIIGALDVKSPQVNAFTNDDLRLLSTLASNLALLVERVRLFNEVEAARIELEQRAKALEEANKRLQELDRLKDQFLASMSHELRTPLNSIIGYSEVLMKGWLGEITAKQQGGVQNILSSGEHLLALINDILDFSKIEAGRMTLEPTTFEVADLLAEVQTTITPLIEKKSQVLTIEQTDDLPPLTADRFRTKQVLLNLLSNANKFTPVEGHITISCRLLDPTTMVLSVIDTGVGIKPEDQAIIFEEFRQAAGSSETKVKGTGLGLAISKRLIEMQRGRIWLESKYGHGATFSFSLPLNGSPLAPEPEAVAGTPN